MAKKQVNITEAELTQIIQESVMRVLNEGVEEGQVWNGIKNIGRQIGAGANALFNKQSGGFGERVTAAKQNWSAQGRYNDRNTLIAQLKEIMQAYEGKITPETTIGQLISFLNRSKGGTRTNMNKRLNEMDDEMM